MSETNLQRTEIYFLTVLEAEKSKIKMPVPGEGLLAASACGGRAKRGVRGINLTLSRSLVTS